MKETVSTNTLVTMTGLREHSDEIFKLPANPKQNQVICKGCGKDFKRISGHLAKSPNCQLKYDSYSIKIGIKKEMGLKQSKKVATESTLDKAVDCGEQNEKTMEVEKIQSNTITTATSKVKNIGPNGFVCKGCGKEFVRIFKHFEKSPVCKPLNDVASLELRIKEKRKRSE